MMRLSSAGTQVSPLKRKLSENDYDNENEDNQEDCQPAKLIRITQYFGSNDEQSSISDERSTNRKLSKVSIEQNTILPSSIFPSKK